MPRGVLVDPKATVKQEYYAGVVWDGRRKQPMMLFSDMGGIDIEEVGRDPSRACRAGPFLQPDPFLGVPGQAGHRLHGGHGE